MSYAQLPYLYTNVILFLTFQPYSVVEPYMDYYSHYYGPQYQYEYYNYARDRYDDYVRNKSQKELDEIKLVNAQFLITPQMRQKIEKLAKTAKEKDLQIELESRKLEKEKEVVLQRLSDAKRREELAHYERERIENAKKNLQYRYSTIPRYSDLYPHPYFREFYGGPVHSQAPVIHQSCNGDAHCCEERHTQTPQRCKSCYKEKTTYLLPPIKQYAASPPSYY